MFPVDQLQRFQVINPDHKFIKPWWDTFTDYIATALLMMAVLAGVMQATQRDLVCVPAIDCSLSHNQSFNHSGVCQGSKSTMLLKLPDRRLYDYVEKVCGRTAVHWFVAYFPFIISLEAIILIVVQNFWLKYPGTASIIDQFLSLVIECYNMTWTSSALENAIYEVNMYEENERRRGDISETKNTSTSATASLDIMEGIKAKALYEKVDQFRKSCLPSFTGIFRKIFWIHLFQVILQLAASIATFDVNIYYLSTFNNNMICKIDDIIDKNYSYFKCTNGIVSYLEVTNITFCILIGLYFIFCFCNLIFCVWTFMTKRFRDYNGDTNVDMCFLLCLLKKCNKLHFVRFRVFLTVEMKQETENEILMIDKWPSKRFKKIAEDDGRALQLFNVDDTTKTIFKTEELKFLRLENCNVYGYLLHNQLHNDFWKSIDSLSIVSCGLYYVPDVILTRMWSLVKLDLSHNKIKTIPKNIGQIKFLRYLDISYNNISEGIDNLLQMQTLVKLNLRGNDSIKLNEDHLQQEINLMKLEISDDVLEETFMMTEEMSSKLENIIVTLPENDFVIKYSLERAPIIEDMRKNRQCYNMTSNPKGVVAIIDTTADGNKYENLERVFKEIGYNVEKVPQDNVSTIKSLEKTLSDLFRGYDSAILIMTAEGYIDGLYLGDELVDIDKIYKCLPKNGLKGKPKLIFLQVDSIAKNPDYIYKPSRAFTYPDTFIAYTVFYEFQGANQFFETLVEVFSNYAWEEDFLSLMKCVKYELSRKFRNKEYEHFYAPKIGGLKKKLYFFPGYYDNRVRITNV